jgi:hypothetical protein
MDAPGGQNTGANPTDKGKKVSMRHVVVDREGVPLWVIHSAANIHDSKVLEHSVDAIEPIGKPRGRARKHPKKLHAYPRARTSLDVAKHSGKEAQNPPYRSAGHRLQPEAGQIQVGGAKHALVDEPLPVADGALGASRRHPSGARGSRMRSHLLAVRSAVMLGALNTTLTPHQEDVLSRVCMR